MNDIHYSTFVAGAPMDEAARALDRELAGENPGMTYSQMMRLRLAGRAARECADTYFIATCDGAYTARLWYGWGTHPGSIGNFGNFKTLEAFQRRGIGRHLLDMLHADRLARADLPLALFCTCSQPHLVRLYGEYGFRPAIHDTDRGSLYCPLGGSPDTFQEFCRQYYRPAQSLAWRPATIGWRHEVDCLLNFHLKDLGLSHSLPGAVNLEFALLNPDAGHAELLFTDDGRVVGWAFTPAGGDRAACVAPEFQDGAL